MDQGKEECCFPTTWEATLLQDVAISTQQGGQMARLALQTLVDADKQKIAFRMFDSQSHEMSWTIQDFNAKKQYTIINKGCKTEEFTQPWATLCSGKAEVDLKFQIGVAPHSITLNTWKFSEGASPNSLYQNYLLTTTTDCIPASQSFTMNIAGSDAYIHQAFADFSKTLIHKDWLEVPSYCN